MMGDCECHTWARMDGGVEMKNGHNPTCPKSIILHVYQNGARDWFVAESIDEAQKMYREFSRNTGCDDDELYFDFKQCVDEKVLGILMDDVDSSKVSKTCAEWCASHGKGFLCTENF